MQLKITSFLFLLGLVFQAQAQDFEGIITYKITLINPSKEVQQMASMMPETMEYKFKDNKARMEMAMMGGTMSTIFDGDAKTTDVLINMMGQKMHTHTPKEQFEKQMMGDFNIEQVDGATKEIAGYKCKKVIGTTAENIPIEIYYTEDLHAKAFNLLLQQLGDLKGLPLEFTIINQGMKMLLTATSVDAQSISDSLFEVPDGYQTVESNPFGGN